MFNRWLGRCSCTGPVSALRDGWKQRLQGAAAASASTHPCLFLVIGAALILRLRLGFVLIEVDIILMYLNLL